MVVCSDTDVGGGGMMNDMISSGVSSMAGVTILVGGSMVTFTTEKQQEQLIIKCQFRQALLSSLIGLCAQFVVAARHSNLKVQINFLS